MAISLYMSADSDYTLRVTIRNHGDAPISISKENLEITRIEVCSPNITTNKHSRLLKSTLASEIKKHFKQRANDAGFFSFNRTIEIKPAQPDSFLVSLAELADHPFFDEQPHCFTITIQMTIDQLASPIEAILNLTWYPFTFKVTQTAEYGIEPVEPLYPPRPSGDIMLEYRDTKPFYLNVAEPSTLRLWITGENQNNLINHADSKPALNTTLTVEFVDTQMNPQVAQLLARKFQNNDIKLTKKDRDTLMILPIENPKANLSQDRRATLRITLTPPIDQASVTCEIPVLLQRPAFPGHIAIDFGTTNSAIAYYDPNDGIPEFPNRRFSDSQFVKLNTVIHDLMDNVDNQASLEYRYRDAAQQLVQFARMMWTTDPQGNQVQSIADIKEHFKRLQRHDVDLRQIGDWQAKLLVSWGIIGYHRLKINGVPLAVLNFIAEQYFHALNRIIDIDMKTDAKLGLPELDPGQRDGTIPSDIMMNNLTASGNTDQQYPNVDGLQSEIDMGEAVKAMVIDPNSVTERPSLPNDGKQKHHLYLSGAKRGLGLKETSYFTDDQKQAFVDTYDPLCTAAVKELLIRTEQGLNERRNCLNNAVVTYPANLPQYRRDSYRKILQSLGVAHIDMSFDEATAGALYYVWRELFKDLFAGIDGFLARSRVRPQQSRHPVTGESRQVDFYYQNILLYDLGGGTTDIALLEIGLEEIEGLLPPAQRNAGRYFMIRPKILGLTGREDFGGDNVTLAVFRILKSKLASTAARLLSDKFNEEGRINEYSRTVQEAVEAFELGQQSNKDIFTEWFAEEGDKKYAKKEAISEANDGIPATTRDLCDLIEALVMTRFESNPESQPHFFGLWQEAERIKKVLSTPPVGYQDIPLPDTVTASPAKLLPAIAHLNLEIGEMELGNISVTKEEMERLVNKDIKQTFEKARDLCVTVDKESGYETGYMIDRLVLAGSGSHLRLVREQMPREVLSQQFTFVKGDRSYPLEAPFKPDGYNLEFTPDDAKLAVVRGASLPRYFKTTRVPPHDPQIGRLLTEGVNFLDFDVDNLRNYMPFTLIYAVGNARDILFESGKQMQETSRTGQAAIRQQLPAGDTINCYRVDSVAQLGDAAEEQYYAQFPIRDDFIQFWQNLTGEELLRDIDQARLDELMNKYFFWAEFDIERNMKCFMYTKPIQEGNDDKNYVNQTAKVIDSQKLSDAMTTLVDSQNGPSTLKPNIALSCPVGVGGQQSVKWETVSSTFLEGRVSLTQQTDNNSGITYIALSPDSPPLWQIDLQNYSVKNHQAKGLVQPELYIKLELENEQVQLKYTVFDPDLTDDHVREIEMSHDSRRAKPPFNPYRGEE